MKVLEFPMVQAERWALSRELDNIRFDILNARSLADRLRQVDATPYLAQATSPENLRHTLEHLDSLLTFFCDVRDRMIKMDESPS
jgi:hypothetical protein